MALTRVYHAGESLEDFCRACKTDRLHTVVAADADGPADSRRLRLLRQRAQLSRRAEDWRSSDPAAGLAAGADA